jgi:hypothetical protein
MASTASTLAATEAAKVGHPAFYFSIPPTMAATESRSKPQRHTNNLNREKDRAGLVLSYPLMNRCDGFSGIFPNPIIVLRLVY